MLYLKENHQPLSAVVFDLGNVMLDFSPRRFMFEMGLLRETFDRIEAATVLNPNWHKLDFDTMSQEDFLEDAIRHDPMLKREITQFMRHWKEYFHALPYNVETFYRVKEAGVKTYILSNFMRETFAFLLPHNAFLLDFDGAVLSYELGYGKPDPWIYRYTIEHCGLNPSESVFFDDLPANCAASIAAGLPAVNLPACAHIDEYLVFED